MVGLINNQLIAQLNEARSNMEVNRRRLHVRSPWFSSLLRRFEDGEFMGGRIRYAYPLRLAQRDGYFAPIDYRAITDLGEVDRALAEAAVAQLRADIDAGRDHMLMARVQSIPRAEAILEIYEDIAGDLRLFASTASCRARQQEA